MKQFLLGIIAVATISQTTQAVETAGYFRAWQGFTKAGMNQAQFLSELPQFMKDTVQIYRERALNNYLVVIPPANRPAYVPDELALVALNNKETYDSIRATPEGQAYSARHWDVFNKDISKSSTPEAMPEALVNNKAYNIIGENINWARGATYVFIGTKKSAFSTGSFLKELYSHVALAKKVMLPKGLRGYVIIANENYEVAYLNWESKEAHDSAGQSEDGKGVFADANRIMDVLMYQQALPFNAGDAVSPDKAYSTLQ